MKKNRNTQNDSLARRTKAEEILKSKSSDATYIPSESELLKLVHEFDVFQIELELQNAELTDAINEAADAVELYDFAPVGYFTLSREGVIKRLNLSGAALLGNERSVLVSKLFRSYISHDTKPIFDHFLLAAFKNLALQSCELTLSKDSQSPTYCQVTGIVKGEEDQCLVTVTDITLRRQAEEVIARSEERYRFMFANNPEPMWVFDTETLAFLEVNHAAVVHYGYSVEEFLSMTLKDIRPVEDMPELLKNVAPTDRTYNQPGEFRHVKKNGEIIDVLITWHAVIFKGRKARHVLVNDITKRKQAERALETQNNLLSKITQFSIDLAALPATENFEVFITKRIKELTGALFVSYSEYDPENLVIVPRHIDLEPGMMQKVVRLLGNKVQNVHSPVDEVTYLKITEKIIGKYNNLTDATFGAIPRPVSSLLASLVKADRYIGIGYIIEGKLYGTSLLAMSKHQPDPSDEILQNIAFLLAVSIRRKRAEEALLLEQWRLESNIEGTHVGTWEWNVQTGETVFNEQWAEIIGYTLDELKPLNISVWEKYAHPDDLKQSNSLLQRHFSDELPYYNCECRMKHKDGSWVWIHDRGRVITRTEDGKPLMMYGTHSDITERKQAEQVVKAKEIKYRNLVELSPNAIVIHRNGKIIFVNPAAVKMFGATKEQELLGCPILERIHPDFHQIVLSRIKTSTNDGGKAPVISLRYLKLDGTIIEGEVQGMTIIYDGEPAIQVVINDITESKRVKDALIESETRFRRLYESASLAIFQTTPDGKVISVNPSFAKMLGYASPEEVKNNVKDAAVEFFADPNRRNEILRLLDETPELKSFENVYRRMDGSTFIGRLNISRIFNDEGRLEYLEGFIEDITERKLAEEAVMNSKLRYDKLAANIPVGVYILHSKEDGTFKLDYASPRMAEMLGLSVEGLLKDAKLVYESIYPGDRAEFELLNQDGIKLKKPFNWTGRISTAGEIRWLHITSSPETMDNGDVLWHGLVVDITKEKLAEDALSEAHNRLLKIAALVPGLIYQFRMSPDGTFSLPYASEGIKEIYQVGPGEVLLDASKIFTKIHPDDYPGVMSSIMNSADKLSQWNHEYRVKFDDGTIRTLLGNSMPQLEQDGSILWHGFITDITERKQADQALRESESRFKNLFEHHSAIMLLIDPETGLIIDANEAATVFYGYNKAKLQNMNIEDINALPKEQVKMEREKARNNNLNYFIFLHKIASGEKRTVEVHSSPIDFQEKQILFSIIHDITERKRLEDELATLAIRNQTMIETSSDGIQIIDKSGNVIDANDAYCNMLGYTREEMLQMNVADWDTQWKGEELLAKVNDLMLHPAIFETTQRRKDGSLVDVEINATGIILDGCQYQYAATRDITERKLNELILKKKNEELIKVNAEKDKFFSIVAHDLRGPIGGFMGLTERMAEGMAEMTLDEIQNMTRVMKKSSANLYSLLGNLLEWSRMLRGLTVFDPVSILLLPKIHEILLLPLDSSDKKEIAIDIKVPVNLEVYADVNMLASIIRNLVTNAVKFTPKGGNIRIVAASTGDFIEISVTDSGIGMKKEMVENLFNLDINTNRKGTEGELSTGLGLMICKDFIEKHGGKLKVKSTVGEGSTFSFLLPTHTGNKEFAAKTESIPVPELKKLKILIAEDDETSGMLLAIALKPISRKVLTVYTGTEAVEMCKSNPDVDLIMMDIKMPGLSGYEATALIRQFNSKVVIIAQTAYGMENDRKNAIEAGCNEYMLKPVNLTLLKKLIHKYFENIS